jgi:Uma2 family endonuclease
MEARDLRRMTEDEYLAFERASDTKHEYMNGIVYAMAGGSNAHSLVAANMIGALQRALRGGPCVVLTSDARVYTTTTRAYFYPDVTVACRQEVHAKDGTSLVSPTILVEVLSPSTEGYDRVGKMAHYRKIPGIEAIVLVSIEERTLEVWLPSGDLWTVREVTGPDAAAVIPSRGITLRLADVFENVEMFEAAPS